MPMLRQIAWGVQNRPITKNGVLPVTTFLFRKFCFSLGTLYIELIWCTNCNCTYWFRERCDWSIVVTLKPWRILKERTEPAGPFGTMPQEPWHSGKDAKPDRVIQLNCGSAPIQVKATRTWENFNNRGTKMILLSDELWSIANNSKSFANGSKAIIRNNLGLYKHSNIYLI